MKTKRRFRKRAFNPQVAIMRALSVLLRAEYSRPHVEPVDVAIREAKEDLDYWLEVYK